MIVLNINGVDQQVKDGMRTLLTALRDDLELVGAKGGCGIGVCGACTVLIDGKSISSCLLLIEQAAGKEIVTIEGVADQGELHSVQQAYLEEAGFQCAYCTPGFVLSTIALLEENPQPSEKEINEYLGGNLCRCGSYLNIIKSVQKAAKGNVSMLTGEKMVK